MPEDDSRQRLRWAGSCLEDLRAFPEDVQDRIGFDLDRVQRGKQPRDFKYMKTVGKDVYEIRARGADGTYRVFYIA